MYKNKKLSRSACDSLKALPLGLDYHLISRNVGLAPYFREHLRQELKEWVKEQTKPDGTPYNLYTDGLKIYTTIDSKMQKYAEESVSAHMKALQASFDQHWEGKKPWGDDAVIERAKKKTKRYQTLKKAGYSEAEINKSFRKKVPMTIFDWEKGNVQKDISPLDSLRFYYALLNTGFLAMNPKNGEIKAWVGGTNFKYFQYDHVKSKRQVGSTFKPIVYTKALQLGYLPCDYFYNRLVTYTEWNDWEPRNSDGDYGGLLSMMGGLTNSVNTITVDLIMKTGIPEVVELAQQFGIESNVPEMPSIALGTPNISLFEMIQVYGTFANKGIHNKPKYLLRVEDTNGNLIADYAPDETESDTTRVLSEDHAYIMTKMLQKVVDEGTGRRLRWKYGLDNQIAGKTGTTQSHADGWFMGFTPNIVAGAWVGADDPKVHFRDISLGQGANTALPIWGEFMQRVYKDPEYEAMALDTFADPEYVFYADLDCKPRITESEYYVMQNPPEVIEEVIVDVKPNTPSTTPTIGGKPPRPGGGKGTLRPPPRPGKSNTKPPRPGTTIKDLEKEKKKKEKEARKAKRKKNRKNFFKNLFD